MSKTINTILSLTDKFTPKLTEAKKQALLFKAQLKNSDAAAKSIDSALASAAQTAVAFGAAATAAVAGFAVASVNTYKEFQSSMSNVAGILGVDQNSEEYERLEEAAREAGKTTTKSAQEAADALSYMALAGWSVDDSISSLEPILRASEATGADLATTSDLITDSMSALGLATDDLQEYLDICAKAQNKSNTTLTQMQEAYIGVGGTFKNFGTDLEESAALLGVLANRGIKGSEAGTRLQSTLVNLTKQSGESYKAMQALGVSAYDANGDFKGITNVLEELNQATAGLTEEERNNYLTMIAGKTQLTTLNALMSGLTNTLEDGTNEFDALFEELENCDGALNKMADTMTDNLEGALSLAQSATQDFQIEIGSKLEPYVTQAVRWFSELLPDATEKFGAWLDNKLPRALDACKSAFDKLKPIVSFFVNNFSEIATVTATVVVGLKALSTALKVRSLYVAFSKTLTGYTTTAKLATVIQTAFNTSILACPITRIVAGLTAVTALYLAWKKHMEKADIAKHFGDITLSMEECEEIVENMFGSELIGQVDEASSAYEDFQASIDAVSDSAKDMSKLNFKLEFGGDVSPEDYQDSLNTYLENLQESIDAEKYSVKMNMDLLFGDSSFGATFTNDVLGSLDIKSAELQAAAAPLQEYLQNAVTNGLTIDTDYVREQFAKISEIQTEMEEQRSNAKLEAAKYDFSTGDLSYDSFQNLMDATNTELENLKETYSNARIEAIANAASLYGEGTELYARAVEEANAAYTERVGGLTAKGLSFENDAIMSAYSEEFAAAAEAAANMFDESLFWENVNQKLASGSSISDSINSAMEGTDIDMSTVEKELEAALDQVFGESFSGAAREHIGEFYEAMMPSVDELQGAMKNMETVPQSFANVFTQSSVIGAVGKNSQALQNVAVTTMATVLPSDQTELMGASSKYADSYIEGIESKTGEAQSAAEALRNAISNTLSQSLMAQVQVEISASVSEGGTERGVGSNPSFATGTTYFGGGIARINENGGEIVDLPTGTRVIPADKSAKMVSGGSNISLTVNVNGNIYGEEDAINRIGGGILEQLYDTILAM